MTRLAHASRHHVGYLRDKRGFANPPLRHIAPLYPGRQAGNAPIIEREQRANIEKLLYHGSDFFTSHRRPEPLHEQADQYRVRFELIRGRMTPQPYEAASQQSASLLNQIQ